MTDFPQTPENARAAALRAALKEIEHAPALRRGNGFGFTLLGTLRDQLVHLYWFKMYWFTALWIPIFPVAVYLVDNSAPAISGVSYRFLRRITLGDFHRIYADRIGSFYLSVLVESVLFVAMTFVALGLVIFLITSLRYAFR